MQRTQGVVLRRVGDTHDDTAPALDWPGDGTVGIRPAKGTQVNRYRATHPQRST